MTTEKSKTNKKWTSNDDYKGGYDRIFGKKIKEEVCPSYPNEPLEATTDERDDSSCWRCVRCNYTKDRP